MIRWFLVFFALGSVLIFPWPYAVFATGMAVLASPLAPLFVGIFTEALYYAPSVYAFPLWLALGVAGSLAAFFVHRFVETSIMKK